LSRFEVEGTSAEHVGHGRKVAPPEEFDRGPDRVAAGQPDEGTGAAIEMVERSAHAIRRRDRNRFVALESSGRAN
jgi:hypothetical protein